MGSRFQPARELAPNKRKVVKGNESEIAFICFHKFFRIWPFQRVTADSIKKFLSRLSSRPRLWAKPYSHRRRPTVLAAFLNAEHHTADFCLGQERT
jgi:hypothetical protein